MDGRPRVPPADVALRAAVELSCLRDLASDTAAELFTDATRLQVPAGALLRSAGDAGPHLELVIRGLVRVFVLAPDGRTLTVRYCRAGDLIGAVSLFRDPYVMAGSIQAVEDSDVLALRPGVARRLASSEMAVARAFLDELSDRVVAFVAEIPGSAFASVRQRVARHLLDLGTERQEGAHLVARVSQQELADAVGTAREVIVRVLRDLRAEGMVATGRDGIVLRAPGRLYAEQFAARENGDADAGSSVRV